MAPGWGECCAHRVRADGQVQQAPRTRSPLGQRRHRSQVAKQRGTRRRGLRRRGSAWRHHPTQARARAGMGGSRAERGCQCMRASHPLKHPAYPCRSGLTPPTGLAVQCDSRCFAGTLRLRRVRARGDYFGHKEDRGLRVAADACARRVDPRVPSEVCQARSATSPGLIAMRRNKVLTVCRVLSSVSGF